jgi:hypothetical protein
MTVYDHCSLGRTIYPTVKSCLEVPLYPMQMITLAQA